MTDYLAILKEYWGYDCFRGIQEDIIRSIGRNEDTLGLMPTGGGKSITFQVPALSQEGLCLVITPLIALMKDQVQSLRQRGIKALAIYAGMSRDDIITALENCIFGNYKFLYISPERLDTELFRTKLRRMKVCMIKVDESHCISQWGYDFRPAYLKIAEVRQLLPDVPILALTATATPEVAKDIQKQLCFKRENVFRMSFERENLAYIIRNTDNKHDELLHILQHQPGSAIVYVRNRRRTKEIATALQKAGITASFYHAGLDDATRDLRQQDWLSGKERVIVATNAFGMGIDKPDVRLVIHMDLPDSMEAYSQEAGRAGRDGKKAYAIILYAKSDRTTLLKRIADSFPPKEYIRDIYEHLQYYYQMAMGDGQGCVKEFDIEDFCRKFKYFPVPVDSALRILTQAGYLEYTDTQDNASRLLFTLKRDELYKLREMGEEMELLIQTVLRSYTGLFTDYTFIDEEAMAVRTGLSRSRVYELLTHLSHLRIASYIPRKKTPYIIYTRERVEAKQLNLSHEIYEDRKERYQKRIENMLAYASNDKVCRSRLLLYYLGEKNEHNCGICDVCLQRRKKSDTATQPLAERIMQLLRAQAMTPGMLARQLPEDKELLVDMLHKLIDTERIIVINGMLQPNDKPS